MSLSFYSEDWTHDPWFMNKGFSCSLKKSIASDIRCVQIVSENPKKGCFSQLMYAPWSVYVIK